MLTYVVQTWSTVVTLSKLVQCIDVLLTLESWYVIMQSKGKGLEWLLMETWRKKTVRSF